MEEQKQYNQQEKLEKAQEETPFQKSISKMIDPLFDAATYFFKSDDKDHETGNHGFLLCMAADSDGVENRFAFMGNINAKEMAAYIAYNLTKRPFLIMVMMDAMRMVMKDQFLRLEQLGAKLDDEGTLQINNAQEGNKE